MAEYKSAYTGAQIDAGIARANTALQEHQSLKTINNINITGEGNINTKDSYSINLLQSEENIYLTQADIDYIYNNKPEQLIIHINMGDSEIMQMLTLTGKIDIENSYPGYMIYDTYNELSNKNTLIKIPKTANESVGITDVEYQEKLVSGENIKTINNQSLLGDGNIDIQGGGGTSDYTELTNKPKINNVELSGDKTLDNLGIQTELVSGTNIKTINNQSILGSGNITIQGGTGIADGINVKDVDYGNADLESTLKLDDGEDIISPNNKLLISLHYPCNKLSKQAERWISNYNIAFIK